MTSRVAFFEFRCSLMGMPEILVDEKMANDRFDWAENATSCRFSPPSLQSTETIQLDSYVSSLQDELQNATAFVTELWLTINSTSTSEFSKPIVIFGSSTEEAASSQDTECEGLHLGIFQRGSHLEVRYIDQNAAQSCRVLVVSQEKLQQRRLHQIMLQLEAGTTSVYMDGSPIIENAPNRFDTSLSTWHPNGSLKVFASPSTSRQQRFDGQLSYLSIYSDSVNVSQVKNMYDEGLSSLLRPVGTANFLRLVADAETAFTRQGQTDPFAIGGYNMTSAFQEWALGVEILSLPDYGDLFFSEEDPKSTAQVGSRLALDNLETHTSVWYRPPGDDFFTVPRYTYRGVDLDLPEVQNFTYRLVAWLRDPLGEATTDDENDNPAPLLAWSDPVAQEIITVHVNHPPSMEVQSNFSVPGNQEIGLLGRPRANFPTITVEDIDLSIDRIRVNIFTYDGTLTIGSEELALADFTSCRMNERYSLLGLDSFEWNCHGSGTANRNMTFLTEPDNLPTILSSIEYKGFYWNATDEVVIRVYDGSGGLCLSKEEHSLLATGEMKEFATDHGQECFETEVLLTVPPISRPYELDSEEPQTYLGALFDFRNFGLADAIFWAISLSILWAVIVCICRCCRCCRRLANSKTDEDSLQTASTDE